LAREESAWKSRRQQAQSFEIFAYPFLIDARLLCYAVITIADYMS